MALFTMIKAPSSSWECRLALWLDGKNLTSVFWFVFCVIYDIFETVILIHDLFYCACCRKWKEFLIYILRGWQWLHHILYIYILYYIYYIFSYCKKYWKHCKCIIKESSILKKIYIILSFIEEKILPSQIRFLIKVKSFG